MRIPTIPVFMVLATLTVADVLHDDPTWDSNAIVGRFGLEGGEPRGVLYIDKVKGSTRGRESKDDLLVAAGLQVSVKMVQRPILVLRITGERALLHEMALSVEGQPLIPSELTIYGIGNKNETVWIYDEPWPKGTTLVGKLREGGEWLAMPLTLNNLRVAKN